MATEGLPVVEELDDEVDTVERAGVAAARPVSTPARAGANRRLGQLLARLGARVVLPPATASKMWEDIRTKVTAGD